MPKTKPVSVPAKTATLLNLLHVTVRPIGITAGERTTPLMTEFGVKVGKACEKTTHCT